MALGFSIAVQPPARASADIALYPPLAARLRSDEVLYDSLTNY